VYTYNIYVRIYVLLPKPSLRPPFVNLFEKAPISRDLSFKHLSLPLVALLYPLQNRADRSHPFAAIASANIATSRAWIYFRCSFIPRTVRCHWLFVFSILFSLFFFFFFSKIVGRRTRVIGQGSKTWKGYRNSLFPPFLLSLFSHLVSIFFSLFCVSFSFSIFSSFSLFPLSSLEKKFECLWWKIKDVIGKKSDVRCSERRNVFDYAEWKSRIHSILIKICITWYLITNSIAMIFAIKSNLINNTRDTLVDRI